MRRLARLSTLLLLLVSYVAPAVACVFPGADITPQERACCNVMKSDCGQMPMPSTHRCCQKLQMQLDMQPTQIKPAKVHPLVTAIVWLVSIQHAYQPTVKNEWVRRFGDSPSESPPARIAILRI